MWAGEIKNMKKYNGKGCFEWMEQDNLLWECEGKSKKKKK